MTALAIASTSIAAAPPPMGPTGASASAADREAARGFAEKGYELFQHGDYRRALDFFTQAEKRFHAPPHYLYIARSDAKLGMLRDALVAYRRLAEETLGSDAPGPFKEAQDQG